MPQLAEQFHVVAPDLPGFGQSDMPGPDKFHYTFDNIARVIDRIVGMRQGLERRSYVPHPSVKIQVPPRSKIGRLASSCGSKPVFFLNVPGTTALPRKRK